MKDQVYFFQWNIPADNHYLGRSDWYINILAELRGNHVSIHPAKIDFVDLRQVKDWALATEQITAIAEKHFADITKAERIAKAKAELAAAGEFDNPVLERYENNPEVSGQVIHPFFNEILSNHFTPVS